jgi:uncharacterized protein DUF4962/heparinase II/III-like protein/carbohydrate binding protein with CBM4/9 domain
MKPGVLVLAGFCLAAGLSAAPERLQWDFEAGPSGWEPQAGTLTVSRTEGAGRPGGGRASLHLRGRITGDWHYLLSDPAPLQAGQAYRLSGWVRVDRAGPATPVPYLQCLFGAQGGKVTLGYANTERYDRAKMGRWQRLVGEFQVPPRTETGQLALETGADTAVEIDAYLDDVVLEPIERLSAFTAYRLDPLPAALQKARHQHPRLYLNPRRVAELREAIKSTHENTWREVRAYADEAVRTGPPPYRKPTGPNDEQLWQGDVGNAMPVLAAAYLLSGEERYLTAARAWALASCSYPTWGVKPRDGMDLAAGSQLFGLAIVYDWCHEGLGEEARGTIRETLHRRASPMFAAAATRAIWWHDYRLQNHLWVNACGLAAAGLALFDEVEEASAWIGLSLDVFRRTMAALGPDGASHEGMAYWGFGAEKLLKFMHLARELLQVDLYDREWWRNTAAYCAYLTLPKAAWTRQNHIVDLADCPRRHWCGPDYLLRALAHEFRDGYAQWLAGAIDDANIDNPARRWHNLLWFDPSIPLKPPGDRPTLRHFEDMGIVSARSGWSGDESLLVFKCGPFIGHKGVREFDYDPGGVHAHPDANHFVLFGAGEWLIRDDGYTSKWTGQHNTLLVNGRGQRGEGKRVFHAAAALGRGAQPQVSRVVSRPEYDQITGDATAAYPPELGLRRYQRHLLFLKPDVLIVVDEVVLELPQALELRFHPESRQGERDGAAFTARGKKAVLRIEPLTTEGVDVAVQDHAGPGRPGVKELSMFTVRCSTRGSRWRNAVALSWAEKGIEPPRVTMDIEGQSWTFRAGGRAIAFDWTTGRARVRQGATSPLRQEVQ